MTFCLICHSNYEHKRFVFKEMMFGFRDKFEYFQCSQCGCLQITSPPQNISKYYPENYYSFTVDWSVSKIRWLRKIRTEFVLNRYSILGEVLNRIKNAPKEIQLLKGFMSKLDTKILDVGCGSGSLLKMMFNEGFTNLTGIDPYINNDFFYRKNLRILKRDIYQIDEIFDFIMLNHSLEHMNDQVSVLNRISTLLSNEGCLLIRIPIVSSYFWEHYKENWVEIDAPRHFFLHSHESINYIANKTGFQLSHIEYDSTGFEILGSVQYEHDIPLRSENSYSENMKKSIFSKKNIYNAEKIAASLNKEGKGGRACLYFRKKDYKK